LPSIIDVLTADEIIVPQEGVADTVGGPTAISHAIRADLLAADNHHESSDLGKEKPISRDQMGLRTLSMWPMLAHSLGMADVLIISSDNF